MKRRLRTSLGVFATALAVASSLAGAARLDLAKVDELRSLLAEAVAVETADATGRLTATYATNLRAGLRDDLRKLTAEPVLGPAAREALDALQRRDTVALARGRDRLIALERAHGRAG